MHLRTLLLATCLLAVGGPSVASAMGLQRIGTSSGVSIRDIDYAITVSGMFVSGRIDVTFVAEHGSLNGANLRFPLPPGAVLRRAEIYLPGQDRWETAETLGRRQGQDVHDDIVDNEVEVDPLLVQEIGTDLYRARVYPIDTRGSLKIRLYYGHLLELDDGEPVLRVALHDNDTHISTTEEALQVGVHLDSYQWRDAEWEDVDGSDSVSTWVELDEGQAGISADAFRLDEDLVLRLHSKQPLAAAGAVAYRSAEPALPDHVFAQWRPDFAAYPQAQRGPRNVVFLVDVSGSMEGRKLEETQAAIRAALQALRSEDRFGLVAFDSKVVKYDERMRARNEADEARDFVAGLRAGTGTGLLGGLFAALNVGATSDLGGEVDILLVSDGLPTEGPLDAGSIVAHFRQRADELGLDVRVFGVGIGDDLDQSLLNFLTRQTGGDATFALDDGEIRGQTLALFERCRAGGMSQFRVDAVGPGLLDSPFAWPHVFPGTPLGAGTTGQLGSEVVLRWQGRTRDGVLAQEEERIPVPSIGAGGIHLVAPALYARAITRELERLIDRYGETEERVRQALLVGRTYGIVTRYTSMLALESPQLYAEYGIQKVERDAAGIALAPIELGDAAEDRIGGDGTDDGDDDDDGDGDDEGEEDPGGDDEPDWSSAGEGGCACTATAPRDGRASAWWFVALLAAARRYRRERPRGPVGPR